MYNLYICINVYVYVYDEYVYFYNLVHTDAILLKIGMVHDQPVHLSTALRRPTCQGF